MGEQEYGLLEGAYRGIELVGFNVLDSEQVVDVWGRIRVFRQGFP
jgi:hypothetical protein